MNTVLTQACYDDHHGVARTVDVHVRRLRAKLEQFDCYSGTVRNAGHTFTQTRKVTQ